MLIEKDAYKFFVDIEKTKVYYNNHSLCDCVCCRNYYKQIEKELPKLKEFLDNLTYPLYLGSFLIF